MKTFEITTDSGRKIPVSEEIFIHKNTLYRLVGIFPGKNIGYHYYFNYLTVITLSHCQDGVADPYKPGVPLFIYCGIEKNECRRFQTHPLNEAK